MSATTKAQKLTKGDTKGGGYLGEINSTAFQYQSPPHVAAG